MQLPVTNEVLLSELVSSRNILDAWIAKVEAGIPGVDMPTPQEHLEDFLRPLCGELLIVAHKCESLSDVISGEV